MKVISIPLLVLRQCLMRTRQKLSIAGLFCISAFMIVLQLVRVLDPVGNDPGISAKTNLAAVWTLFWGELEACTAVIAASVIVIRSMFVKDSDTANKLRHPQLRLMVMPSWWRSTEPRQIEDVYGNRQQKSSSSDSPERHIPESVEYIENERSKGMGNAMIHETTYDMDETKYHRALRDGIESPKQQGV